MPTPPVESDDLFELINRRRSGVGAAITEDIPGFSSQGSRAVSGGRSDAGYQTRHMVRWLVPEVGFIEMYINPQAIDYNYSKHITQQRTKGGWVLQMWGENLTTINISGTTGTSGIEGINVLENIYRAEQELIEPYVQLFAEDLRDQEERSFADEIGRSITGLGQDLFSLVDQAVLGRPVMENTRPRPTLAAMAFSVEMYWSGWVHRGYFQDFRVQERAERLGLFDYNMTFVSTQRRGLRRNFLPWHRSAVSGPSNSDPNFGIPHSFSTQITEQQFIPETQTEEDNLIDIRQGLVDAGKGLLGAVSAPFRSIF